MPVARQVPRVRTQTLSARQASLREHNLALVLAEIRASDAALSRADLAGRLGLARATVSDLVDRLLGAGMITELSPEQPRSAGRPGTPLPLSSSDFVAYGLDINVNHLGVSALGLAGDVLAETTVPRNCRDHDVTEVLAELSEVAAPIVRSTRRGRRVLGARLSVPGLIQHGTGIVQLAPNLGWRDIDVAGLLGARKPFRGWRLEVGNDADLGARAQLAAGSDASFIYLSGEVGLGGAIVIEGRPLAGQHGWTGEIGHLCVDPNGRPCGCGATGCLEQYVGTEALLRDAGMGSRFGSGEDQVQVLLRALEADDPQAVKTLEGAGRQLGVALSGVINMIDVDTVVLGGPLGLLHPYLDQPIRRELAARVTTASWRRLEVIPAANGPSGTARGAAMTLLDRLVADPSAWLTAG